MVKYKNDVERALGKLVNRWSDQKYYLINYLFYKNHNNNPVFTNEDNKKKCEIFGIPNNKTCFITKEECNGKGDHIFEINGYVKFVGLHGSYDDWNTVPVVGRLNKSYKTQFNNKNIGYQYLTDEDIAKCTEQQRVIYNKIKTWKEYVESRGASLTWKLTEEEENLFKRKKKQYIELWKDL